MDEDTLLSENAVLVIDGENFMRKVKAILLDAKKDLKKYDLSRLDIDSLLKNVLKRFVCKKKIFYSAKLHENKRTLDKSRELIEKQRNFKNYLENCGFEFKYAGHVRSYKDINPETREPGLRKPIFKEKGVDVGMAVDGVSWAYEKTYDTMILASSDSDLQSVLKKCQSKGMKVYYLGFDSYPNKGLLYTSDKPFILLRAEEVIDVCPLLEDEEISQLNLVGVNK